MLTMPRPRPPHLHRQTTQHGRTVWYFRRGHGPRIRIRAEFGSSDFDAEYQGALTNVPLLAQPKIAAAPDSLAWLIARYRDSGAWATLSLPTRRKRENILKHVIASAGNTPFQRVDQKAIVAGRERRAATPAAARHFLDAMRGLFRWAFEAQHVAVDPTAGVKNPKRKKTSGFKMWTEEEMARYEARWPLGSRQRVWLDVAAYTGLRRGDLVRLGRQHVRSGVARLKLEKGGFAVAVTIPILPVLQRTLDAGPCGELTFIVGANGKPLTKESFGNEFRDACKAAGVPGSAHGVRKIAATRAAENGATVAELEAIFGWHGGAMASHYTREANRTRLADQGMHKLVPNDMRTSIPSPDDVVRDAERKAE